MFTELCNFLFYLYLILFELFLLAVFRISFELLSFSTVRDLRELFQTFITDMKS